MGYVHNVFKSFKKNMLVRFMAYINPNDFKGFEKEVNRIMHELMKQPISYSKNTKLSTIFGCKCKNVTGSFVDISRTNYRKKENKVIFSKLPNVRIKPVITKYGVRFHLEHMKKLRL